jgi:hypothetical protein
MKDCPAVPARTGSPGTAIQCAGQSEDRGILQTAKDKLSSMNLDQYYDTCRLVTVYVAHLDYFLGDPAGTDQDP